MSLKKRIERLERVRNVVKRPQYLVQALGEAFEETCRRAQALGVRKVYSRDSSPDDWDEEGPMN